MIAKQIVRSILLVVVLGSLAIWANREYQKSHASAAPAAAKTLPIVAGDQVIMTYFISGTLCKSCQKIEALTKETAKKDFAEALAGGKLVFRVIDTGEPGYQHFIKDYQLTSKTVILSHRKDGKETEWKDMAKVWELLDDAPGFHAYLGEQIRNYLGT
ncbi:MAG: nitrophenyl compound nitroreductase subunit ArsF family protein [Luteolibacter sp.]|jgi:thiol-disulfide isomerase/thioredoxin|nr:nitrophenyl compound nitroreductase subunit ArsF family protein [Luteolibacter sp.]